MSTWSVEAGKSPPKDSASLLPSTTTVASKDASFSDRPWVERWSSSSTIGSPTHSAASSSSSSVFSNGGVRNGGHHHHQHSSINTIATARLYNNNHKSAGFLSANGDLYPTSSSPPSSSSASLSYVTGDNSTAAASATAHRRPSRTRISPSPPTTATSASVGGSPGGGWDRHTPPPTLTPVRLPSPSISKPVVPSVAPTVPPPPPPVVAASAEDAGLAPEMKQLIDQLSLASLGENGLEYLRQRVMELEAQKHGTPSSSREGTPSSHLSSSSRSRHRKEDSRDSVTTQLFEYSAAPSWYDHQQQPLQQQPARPDSGTLLPGRAAPNEKMFGEASVMVRGDSPSVKPPSPKTVFGDHHHHHSSSSSGGNGGVLKIKPERALTGLGIVTTSSSSVVVPDQSKSKSIETARHTSAFHRPSAFAATTANTTAASNNLLADI